MQYLNPVDAAFLRMESKRTPMHVAGLLTFCLPDDADQSYLRELLAFMRSQPVTRPPFNYRLTGGAVSDMTRGWERTDDIDLDYHIRHSALPHPGGERELGVLVSRLHSQPMDLDKPLWECHLIEGLERRRFAIYLKLHHAAGDGMTALKLINDWLSTDPKAANAAGPWATRAPDKPRRSLMRAPPRSIWSYGRRFARENAVGAWELGNALRGMFRGDKNPVGGISAPNAIPRTQFNHRITPQRRLATQLFDLDRVKALSRQTDSSVNDICLALCGSALRRYLLEHDGLPGKTLVASVPVAVSSGAGKGGNHVAGFVCPLGTDIEDPAERLRGIQAVTSDTKARMNSLSDIALNQFALLGVSPLLLGQMSGLLRRLPPLFNLTISNVVGSDKPLYFRGAEMEAMYPMSVLFDGHTLNVTIVGYAGRLAVGVTGCRNTIPNMQDIAVYIGDALTELETAVAGASRTPARKVASRRARQSSSQSRKQETNQNQ